MSRFAQTLAVVAAVLTASLLSGCNSGGAPSASGGGKTRIAAILFQMDQFYRMIEMGMKAAAEQYDVDLLMSNSANSIDKEISLVDTYTTQGVQAMAVAPLSVKSSIPALKRAHDAGIPIVTFDGYIEADFPKSSILSDQVSLGRTTGVAARAYIEQKLGGKAKLALIEYISLAPEPGGMRVQGFKEEISKLPGVEILVEQDAWLAPDAVDKVASILTAYPDVNVIWAANEGGTVGAVTAVRNAGKAGKVVVFGTDMSEEIAGFLLAEDNILQAVTGQKPFEIGFQTIVTALKSVKGEPVESRVSLPGVLFTRDKPEEVAEHRAALQKMSAGQ